MTERRRTFGPLVGLGLAGAALVAVGATKPLMSADGGPRLPDVEGVAVGAATLPLATTLAMVVLAAWGVVLVTRGRLRRAVTVLGALASAGMLASLVSGWWMLPDELRASYERLGYDVDSVSVSGWYWAALVGALGALVASSAAVVLVASWPEMGRRYDTPRGDPDAPRQASVDDDDTTSLDLWQAMDQGRDPTA
jgi:heme A synthase